MKTMPASAPEPRLILLLEDQVATRQWLIGVLAKTFPDAEVVSFGYVRDGFAWLNKLRGGPDADRLFLALLDIGLPDGSGIDLVAEVAEHWPQVLPVVATIYDDDAHLFEAIAAGARGYLLKGEEAEILTGYLLRMEKGEPPLSPSVAHRILTHFRQAAANAASTAALPEQSSLTARETEVLTLLGRGLTVGETAAQLGLSSQTVAGYVKNVYSKLNISSRAQAALEARRRGLV